jgi:HAD superfamily hydrolase (TIGR01509 family)
MQCKGFIFDFDGLILDTEMPRFIAWQEVFQSYGCPFSVRDYWEVIGTGPGTNDPIQSLIDFTHGKLTRSEFSWTVDNRAKELMEKADLQPGVEDFIKIAAREDIPLTIASSSKREWVIDHLEKFDLVSYFKSILTAEDAIHVKPDPELYLLAINKLGLPADSVLAFEDSPNGIKSAKAAGLRCLAVPNLITREMDLSQADQVVESFSLISPGDSFTFVK